MLQIKLIQISSFCFSEFPQGCKSYYGPHTMECYETIWTDVGCVEEGFNYTPNTSMLSIEALKNLNLRYAQ